MIPGFDQAYLDKIAEGYVQPMTGAPVSTVHFLHAEVDGRRAVACGAKPPATCSFLWRCVNCEACRASA